MLISPPYRLFLIFVTKFMSLDFLLAENAGRPNTTVDFSNEDDLDLCLYYLRTLSNIFRWAPDALWDVLSKRTVRTEDHQVPLSKMSTCRYPFFFLDTNHLAERL